MKLAPELKQRFFDSNGAPLVGGKLYSYQAGTTTPLATASDQAGTSNANPIILNGNGECSVWLDPNQAYKFVLADSNDVVQWTVDNVTDLLQVGTGQIQDMAVTTAKINDLAVTTAKLNANAVTAAKLADGAVSTTAKLADAIVTTKKMAAVTTATIATAGQWAISAMEAGSYTATPGTMAAPANLTCTLTTTGRPVRIELIAQGSPSEARIGITKTSNQGTNVEFMLYEGTNFIAGAWVGASWVQSTTTGDMTVVIPPSAIAFWHFAAAGTYTYQLKLAAGFFEQGTVTFNQVKLMAREV